MKPKCRITSLKTYSEYLRQITILFHTMGAFWRSFFLLKMTEMEVDECWKPEVLVYLS